MNNKLMLSLLYLIGTLSFSNGYSQTAVTETDKKEYVFICDYVENGVKNVILNGVIHSNAYYANMTRSGNYSYIFWKDEKAFVSVNGQIMGPYDSVNKSFDESIPVTLTESGKFAFQYSLKGRRYVNVNGTTLGPYPSVDPKSIYISDSGNYTFSYLASQTERFVIMNGKKYGPFRNETGMLARIDDAGLYFYEFSSVNQEDDNYYVCVNGKVIKMDEVDLFQKFDLNYYAYKKESKWYLYNGSTSEGPFDEVQLLYTNKAEKRVVYRYRIKDEWFLYLNGNVSGPFINVDLINQSKPFYNYDFYAYYYETAKGRYANINGDIQGPYAYIKRFSVLPDHTYCYAYESGGKYHININGKNVGGSYGMIDDLVMLEDGTYSFSYREYRQSRDCHVVINGKDSGPYPGFTDNLRVLKDGKYIAMSYSNSMNYLLVTDKSYGPYPSIDTYNLLESGDFTFTASDQTQTKTMVVINDLCYGPFEEKVFPRIWEGGKYLMSVKTEGKYYLMHNGNVLGPFDKLERLRTSSK